MSGLNLQKLLNPEQLAAATTVNGPILILAGAGSGKTRVITHRIAYLINEAGVSPESILAVTFTNKAAEEMRERMKKILGAKAAKVQLSTFHSACARLLRQECELLGMPRNFTIYDSSDQISIIKEVMEDLGIEAGDYKPRIFRSAISRSKNNMLSPNDLMKKGGYFNELTAEVLSAYNTILKKASALDFDDLLLKPLELFKNNEELKTKYRDRYKYLLVDEFQDTNRAQFEFLLYLTGEDKNLCVVGDDDQSIYGWRGADISNILNFEKHFPDTKVFKLEQNYRSTKHILGAASSVVKNNKKRKEKNLWTDSAEGKLVTFIKTSDDRSEAAQIQAYMQDEIFNEKRTFKDFAILYRTNAQSRVLEDALRLEGIAYVIVGGVKFYDRKEVKDLLSYLRLISNPNDSASLKRVINYPPRGLGAVTLSKIKEFALVNKLLFLEAFGRLDEIDIGAKQKKGLSGFRKLIKKYTELKKGLPLEELVRVLDEELGIRKLLKQEDTEESLQREANIRELFNSVSEYCEQNPG
ncbi:MAG: UvrD-helicase domain-containing protein, partial [Bacteroidetes bacterium]|nr:UvrD-helicase domain-containing protein [Bacteroidota bacterium]